jgi:hypothetical protein
MVSGRLAGFLNIEDFASLIVSTLRAGAMGHFSLVTVGALGKVVAFQCVVGAPGGGAPLGVSPFWIRHVVEFLLGAIALKQHLAIGN